ncbi:MAG TPA: hypothetical protein VER98_14475 [Terriglobia bacterium]|nr:hypothetical protein [Terriglobia bacterium]
MKPAYFDEKRYSYHVFQWKPPVFTDYQAADPQTVFEKKVQNLYIQGNANLQKEEYNLALNAFRQLQNLILTTVHPTLPIDSYLNPNFRFPFDISLLDVFAAKTADVLGSLPLKTYNFPDHVVSDSKLADPVVKAITAADSYGITAVTQAKVSDAIAKAGVLVQKGDWAGGAAAFGDALKLVPATEIAVRASIMHDQAIASEKAGLARDSAVQLGNQSAALFGQAKVFDAQVQALRTVAGIQTRAGLADVATKTVASADGIEKTQNLFPVMIRADAPTLAISPAATGESPRLTGIGVARPIAMPLVSTALTGTAAAAVAVAPATAAPQLMLDRFVGTMQTDRMFQIAGSGASLSISLTGNVVDSIKAFLQNISTTTDLGLLSGFGRTYVETVAYLPHMYFFVIPMAIGDCLESLGSYSEAESYYTGTLAYGFINRRYEVVKLWTKLAHLYLQMGDAAYRSARDSVADYATAKTFYEKIIKTDKTLDNASPVYADPQFADIKTRVSAFIAGGMKSTTADNPQILSRVADASLKLQQIKLQFNFFGFPATYIPPFSWEYLQNTAKYFAQQSSQIEQRYIQLKSTAENETLQRTQLDQQAEVARQTVVLETRGLVEAQAGLAVANASLNYATVQRDNAVRAQSDFANVRNQLYEYAEQEAWANASSVNRDDQVKLTMTGYSYYNPSHERRNVVIKELERRRTRISQDLEAARLQRDVNAANAYIGVGQAERNQALARIDIANQRIAIAQLQQRDAEENRDFLDLKEFNAGVWFDLAKNARRLSQKYVDMATEVAFLMERAYNAETERGLGVIRYDYSHSTTEQLMGADYLLMDVDYFSFDYVRTTKTKKAPVKRVISMADTFPMAFLNLKKTGSCTFQTELAQFDRQNPGMYLCKLRNVEALFVGISADSLSGSLRNIGISRFRNSAGKVLTRLYPADTMPISRYDLRQDALAFRVNPNELRLFENNGIDTLWQLNLPLDSNDINYDELLDVQLVLYYDGLFDPGLETQVKAALPANGTATRVLSMSMSFPDELFYLKSNGEAQLVIDATLFSRTQTNMVRKKTLLKITGDPATTHGLKLRLKSKSGGSELLVTTDANGQVAGAAPADPLFVLNGKPVFDEWTLRITAADNPGLVKDGKLAIAGIDDVMAYVEYDFQYRK